VVRRDATEAKNNTGGILDGADCGVRVCRVDLRSLEKHLESYISNLTLSS
jgi:hypothetical protein